MGLDISFSNAIPQKLGKIGPVVILIQGRGQMQETPESSLGRCSRLRMKRNADVNVGRLSLRGK